MSNLKNMVTHRRSRWMRMQAEAIWRWKNQKTRSKWSQWKIKSSESFENTLYAQIHKAVLLTLTQNKSKWYKRKQCQKKERNANNLWRKNQKSFQEDNSYPAHFVHASTTQTHDGTTFQRLKLLHTITALASNGKPRKMVRQMLRKRPFGERLFFIPKISTFFWSAVT